MKTIGVVLILAITALGIKALDVYGVQQSIHPIRLDTTYVVTTVYDTAYVTTNIHDTVVTLRTIDSLAHQDVVRLVCGKFVHGDQRDVFRFNAFGMVICPNSAKDQAEALRE